MSPLEDEVITKVLNGDISWLPEGLSFHGLAADEDEGQEAVEWSPERIQTLEGTIAMIADRMHALEESNRGIVELLKDRSPESPSS